MTDDPTKSDAARVAEIRDLLPTTLGSAEIRAEIAADVRARSVFVSRCANAVFLSKVKEVTTAVANGEMDKASARVTLLETLRVIGYTPEGGFPDVAVGQVPPALKGTLQDLTSMRRLNLIVNTQLALMVGRGQQLRGMGAARMKQAPAWELVRISDRDVPRDWWARWKVADGPMLSAAVVAELERKWQERYDRELETYNEELAAIPKNRRNFDSQGWREFSQKWASVWIVLGSKNKLATRMIALKGHPVWGELGASENFDDALDVDYPPFAFESGMGWRELGLAECLELGLTGPDGETIEDWTATDPPVLNTVPPPVISVADADPELVAAVTASTPAVRVGTKLTPPDNADDLMRRSKARMAALQDASAARMAKTIADRRIEYQKRNEERATQP
jgi:hypothetical protein